METDEIRETIENIIRIVEEIPEDYRIKAFEILLTESIRSKLKTITDVTDNKQSDDVSDALVPFTVPIDVKAFLLQNDLSENILGKLFIIEGSEIRPVYKLKTNQKLVAQIQIACLIALENALRGGNFEFSLEEVRTRVKNLDLYDSSNFKPTFSRRKDLFGSQDDEEHISLSPTGRTELADIIEELVG